MRLVATKKSEQNAAALDPWTAVHVGAGMAFGLMGVRFVPALAMAVGYEIAEQVAERHKWGSRLFKTSGPETGINVALDLVVFAGAWWLARRYSET